MPRNISFALTTEQVEDHSKTVTRRLGWRFLATGVVLMACEKCQGIKKGELRRLGLIRVVNVRREALSKVTDEDVAKEGFPGKSREWFIDFYIKEMKLKGGPATKVTRIEFEYL